MPISAPDTPAFRSAAQANDRGVRFRREGRLDDAIASFREASAQAPQSAAIQTNLGAALSEARLYAQAQLAFDAALSLEPRSLDALLGSGTNHARAGRHEDARSAYRRILAIESDHVAAHLALYELEQILGDNPAALKHQLAALEQQAVFVERAPGERHRVLVLLAPGTWQANVPVDFLIDRGTTTLIKAYLRTPVQAETLTLPEADVVFTAIADCEENREPLAAAASIIARLGLPAVNRPEAIANTDRERAWELLHPLPGVTMANVSRVTRDRAGAGALPETYPLVIRPVGSQAGRDFEKVESDTDLRQYLDRVAGEAFYAMPFVDYRSPDGLYRKYRVVTVDGQAYPFHLAISPSWRIHYYNAPMRENAWMREEEAAFLRDIGTAFDPAQQTALASVGSALGLEYCVIDCARAPGGGVLIFEADPAGVVHAMDDPEIFGYKRPAAERIFTAFERLLDRARSR